MDPSSLRAKLKYLDHNEGNQETSKPPIPLLQILNLQVKTSLLGQAGSLRYLLTAPPTTGMG